MTLDVYAFAKVMDGAVLGVLCSGAGLLSPSSARNTCPQESPGTGQLILSWINLGGGASAQGFYILLHNYSSPLT